MSVTYQQEFLCMCQDEVQPLAEQEWGESGHPTKPLDIDWYTYNALEDLGKLQFYTARLGKELIGYFVVMVVKTLTTSETVGYYDSVYVCPEHRNSRVFFNLLKFVEKHLKEDGVDSAVASSSTKNPIDDLLLRVGYSQIETKHEKVL